MCFFDPKIWIFGAKYGNRNFCQQGISQVYPGHFSTFRFGVTAVFVKSLPPPHCPPVKALALSARRPFKVAAKADLRVYNAEILYPKLHN